MADSFWPGLGMPGSSVLYYLPEFAQIHVHWVGDAIQPSHPAFCRPLLLLPSILPSIRVFFNKSLFPTGGQSIEASALAIVLPINIQGWFLLGLNGLISLLSKGLSRAFSCTSIWKHQFFSIQPSSLWSNSHIRTWLLEKQMWGLRTL